MWQLEEVDSIAVVNLNKPLQDLFAEPNCSALGTISKMAKYIFFQGVEFPGLVADVQAGFALL